MAWRTTLSSIRTFAMHTAYRALESDVVKDPSWDCSQDRGSQEKTRSQHNMAVSTNESMLGDADRQHNSVSCISGLAPVSCGGGVYTVGHCGKSSHHLRKQGGYSKCKNPER